MADGIRADSAAKESAGAAATLGSQAAIEPDEVVVPDAITANNEGNLESSPTYVGRMFALRPWEMKLALVPTVQAGGSGYAVNDTIDLNGVAGVTGAPVLTVDAVSAGAVTAVSITEADGVEIRRGGMTGAPSPADNPVGQAATSGGGTGATFNCIWEPHFELRFITEDASQTLTVHEPWIVPPVSGDNWAVGYTLNDYATVQGITFRQQSGVFEATRRIKIGPLTDGTRRGWLAMNDGKALELDNVTDNGFEIAAGGLFTMGQLSGGESVNGAYISTSSTGGVDISWGFLLGMFFVHDFQLRSPREQVFIPEVSSSMDDDERLFAKQAGFIMRNTKIFRFGPMQISGYRMRDTVVQADPTDTTNLNLQVLWSDNSQAEGQSLCNVNRLTIIGLPALAGSGTGLFSARSVTSVAVVADFLRNITILQSIRLVSTDANETWRFVNPVWSPTLSAPSSGARSFGLTSTSFIEELFSLVVSPVTPAGVELSGVHGYVYEGALNNDLPTENTNQSDSAAYDPISDSRFEDEILSGAVVYFSDVLNAVYSFVTSTLNSKVLRGVFAWRGYDYGNLPVTIPLTVNLAGGINLQAVFLFDVAITEPVQATALTNPTTNPVVTRHALGETDTRPMKALNYDAGTGGVPPSLAEVLTQGSATGVVVEVLGDDDAGTVLLDTWNGTEFTDGQTITGGTSAFSATTNLIGGTGFYEEYTWEVDANAEAMTIVYDYLAARMAEATLVAPFDDVIIWGSFEPNANQLVFFGANGYFTNRATRTRDGILKTTLTPDFEELGESAAGDLSAQAEWDVTPGSATGEARFLASFAGVTPDDVSNVAGVQPIALATHIFTPDQYARCVLTALPTTDSSAMGVACRIDPDTGAWYGAIIGDAGASNEYRLVFAAGDNDVQENFGTGAATPTVNDVIELICFGNLIIMLVNDVEQARAVDDRLTAGQAGIRHETGTTTTPTIQMDTFEFGDLVADDFHGEGVWIHDRGAGVIELFTSDDGVTFTPPVALTITVTGLVIGSEVRVLLAGTNTEVAGVESTVGVTFAFAIDSGVSVDIIVINVDQVTNIAYIPIRRENVSFTVTQDFPVVMRLEDNFDAVL